MKPTQKIGIALRAAHGAALHYMPAARQQRTLTNRQFVRWNPTKIREEKNALRGGGRFSLQSNIYNEKI